MNWSRLLNHKRRRPTTIPKDPRSEFERDFDRAVFSTPVKRLQDKAQVFPLEPHDAVRTRLTHSLEVSSVARGLATCSAKWLCEQGLISQGMDRSIEAIAATCGLIHDLGNPPFGHAGEDAIRAWFDRPEQANLLAEVCNDQQTQDFLKFEVTPSPQTRCETTDSRRLQWSEPYVRDTLRADEVRDPVTPCRATRRNRAFRKPGYFASERRYRRRDPRSHRYRRSATSNLFSRRSGGRHRLPSC